MDTKYDHKKFEKQIYEKWEKGDYFKAVIDKEKKPFTVILPPPNASGKMHTGNILMIAIEDILIRWKRMQGYNTLWVPGTDHAGFETQTTFERKLKAEGKSRFDFDRSTLYSMIYEFVLENKSVIEQQIRNMGASVDWSRYSFTLDKKSIDIVTSTFEKMEKEGLVYRDDYVVNYSFKWGTTFSDAEISYEEKTLPLYYIKYYLINKDKNDLEYITVATVRPEPIFVDTHLCVHPDDKSKQYLIGKKVKNPLTGKEMDIITDNFVDPKFGTGIVKLTPAHDKKDYEVARKHNLPVINLINLNGTLNSNAGELEGLTIKKAREKVVEILTQKGLIEKIDFNYQNVTPVDYRSGDYIENLVLPNWFIKVESLKKPALESVINGDVKIYPKWRESTYTKWVENMYDWAISRQVTWGIRIPAWYSIEENPNLQITFIDKDKKLHTADVIDLLKDFTYEEIESGLQSLIARKGAKYVVSKEKPDGKYIQETDTFDTWFSSGQWPLITLGFPDSPDFKYFYPIDVMETGWEIVTRWVSRMMMFGYYLTGKAPFKNIYLHGMVRAVDGKKMSKSLGNVVNPEDYIEKYGVDALRMGLISGTANGKDFSFPHDKVVGYRNFTNKIWNVARFMNMLVEKNNKEIKEFNINSLELNEADKEIINNLNKTIKGVNESLENFRFSDGGEIIYHFVWDEIASNYIEDVKLRSGENLSTGLTVLVYVFSTSLKLLHPFMPFVTEAIWDEIKTLNKENKALVISKWPE